MLKSCCNEQHQCCKESLTFLHHQLQSPTTLIMLLWTQNIATHNIYYSWIFTWTHNNVQTLINTKKHTKHSGFFHMFHSKKCALHLIHLNFWHKFCSKWFCYEQQTIFKLLPIWRCKIEAIIWLHRVLKLEPYTLYKVLSKHLWGHEYFCHVGPPLGCTKTHIGSLNSECGIGMFL